MSFRPILNPSISCVIPAFNEAGNLPWIVPQTLTALRELSSHIELLVVDDGSRDDTARVMQALCAAHAQVVYVKLSRNFGKESALTAGIELGSGAQAWSARRP